MWPGRKNQFKERGKITVFYQVVPGLLEAHVISFQWWYLEKAQQEQVTPTNLQAQNDCFSQSVRVHHAVIIVIEGLIVRTSSGEPREEIMTVRHEVS